MADDPVPSFENPPVVEVVWSVQFPQLSWMTAAHTGLFWERIRSDYPVCEEHAPLRREEEPSNLLRGIQVTAEVFSKPPLCRQWFISELGADLLQLQSDRLCVNWRKTTPADVYPRYAYMRTKFESLWGEFSAFAEQNGGEDPRVELCELTYVNSILKDEGWSAPGDVGRVLPVFSWNPSVGFLPPPATLAFDLVFDIRGETGRVRVSCRHAKTQDEAERELFRLDLTARGKPESADLEGVLDWFAMAREWIVRAFADVTAPGIQKERWRRQV